MPPSEEGMESTDSGSGGVSSKEDAEAGSESIQPETEDRAGSGSASRAGEPTEPSSLPVPEDARPEASSGPVHQGVQTAGERTAALDEELARSLAEFDGELLKEQEILEKERREEAQAAAAEEAAYGAESGGYSGGGEYADSEIAEAEGGDLGGAEESEVAEQEGEEGGGSAGGGGGGRVPSDVGDGSDDDIIARQLREAAMAEDDPELREKLWEEYREYKSGKKKS